MKGPTNLNLRQTLEGMPITFNPEASAGLEATIQFNVSGGEPSVYHLSIADGECLFHEGSTDSPTLTINTPADIWQQISRGKLSGQDALIQGLYTASGDLNLMLRMDSLFKSVSDVTYEAPSSQRPAGPIPLPGMAWMTVAFIPWILHWVMFEIPGISHWISVGLPLLLSLLIVSYRLVFDRPTWMEWGSLGFFTLAGALALTGSSGYAHWGSIVSSVVMAGLWLISLRFSKMPLSGEYSKWDFVKALWQNSMFIYPNAVISLVWGWQFIAASLLGIAAILLPEQMLTFTLVRYLLLVPAFIFTSTYQKRVPISNPKLTDTQLRFWAGMGLSAVSGLLLTATMPGFDVPFLGWIALVPLLMIITTAPVKQHYALALPFGLLLSIGVHNWYPHIFPPALGYFLIFAVGTFYAGMLQLGSWLQSRLPGALKLLALPVAWSAVEFVKFIAPVVEDWWFVLLAKSMWRFPPIMLANVAIMGLVIKQLGIRDQGVPKRASFTALVVVAGVVIWGATSIPTMPSDTFTIAALTDMVNQDPEVLTTREFTHEDFGTSANSPETSQAIFNVDAALSRQIAALEPDFIVWPENEFADADDPQFIDQLNQLAVETESYIVADVVWHAATGMHDTALMVGPSGD